MKVLNIGRLGDIINLLPMAKFVANTGKRMDMIVGKEFAEVLDGVSYCDRTVFDGPCHDIERAMKRHGNVPNLYIAQVFLNRDQARETDSFAKESWRLVHKNWLKWYGAIPLEFDRRDDAREAELVKKHIHGKTIAVAPSGISSPFPGADKLASEIKNVFKNHEILDMSKVKAAHVYDLIGLIDKCECLVSVDTVHLWLARCARTPVIGLHNNGWWGSPIGQTEVAMHQYDAVDMDHILSDIERTLGGVGDIIMVVDKFGKEARHKKASASWNPDSLIYRHDWPRSAVEIADNVPLPHFKDLIAAGMERAIGSHDVVIWTNDDVIFPEKYMREMSSAAAKFGATSCRRENGHCGREAFAFSRWWLDLYFNDMPDVILAAPYGDIAVAKYIRQMKGVTSNYHNIGTDFFPCEIELSGIKHIDHGESAWHSHERLISPSAIHNKILWED